MDGAGGADGASGETPGAHDPTKGLSFYSRKWVKPEELNAHGSLHGGSLLRWIDEDAAIYAVVQLGNTRLVTKFISEIVFEATANRGDLLELGIVATAFGRTSITVRAKVHNLITGVTIITIEKMVFVALDEHGAPTPHGYSEITLGRERLPLA